MERKQINFAVAGFLMILSLLTIGQSSYAQFSGTGEQATLTNIKYLSQDETMALTKIFGNLSIAQSKQIYIANLNVNRKLFSHLKNVNSVDKSGQLYQQSLAEKMEAYRKILSPAQFQAYMESTVKENRNFAGNKSSKTAKHS
jgi:hypothetical protein